MRDWPSDDDRPLGFRHRIVVAVVALLSAIGVASTLWGLATMMWSALS